jgi:hypothetical protein
MTHAYKLHAYKLHCPHISCSHCLRLVITQLGTLLQVTCAHKLDLSL